jgi:hypothetical protein
MPASFNHVNFLLMSITYNPVAQKRRPSEMREKSRALAQRSQKVVGAELACSANVLAPDPTSDREAALSYLSRQAVIRERPDWAPSDLEEIFYDAVETICETEGISWQAFIDRAFGNFPTLPKVVRIRITVAEYFRTSAGWLPELSQPNPYALHEPPLVRLQDPGVYESWQSGE